MSTPRWGDDLDDSDDEDQVGGALAITTPSISKTTGAGQQAGSLTIPPTHKSRIDSNGVQIVTSYKPNPGHPNSLIKTTAKVKVEIRQVRESTDVGVRRTWRTFGQAAVDEEKGDTTTVQSKDEIFLEDPNADTDLQDEDPAQAIAGNLNAFWKKQNERAMRRQHGLDGDDVVGAGGADAGGAGGGGWTEVVKGSGGGAGGAAGADAAGGKYISPAMRARMAGGTAAGSEMPGGRGGGGGGPGGGRTDDLNTIRVTNLSENTTEADLQDLFQRYGRISRVYLAKDKETMQSRGFAFVSFVNKEDAAQAMDALQGFGYDHLILKLEWARPNAPKDPATSGNEFRSGYGKALAQDTKEKVSYASNLTKGTR